MLRILSAMVLALSAAACAFGTTNIDIAAPAARAGVISEAKPARIDVVAVTDARPDQTRIGNKRNGYGQVLGAIGSTQPPVGLVERTLEQVLTANKHTSGGAQDRFALETKLKNFWLDYKTGLVTVEFFGTVSADYNLVDRSTGQTLYSESIEGYYSEKNGGGLSKTWARIMSAALTDFAAKFGGSDGLKAAIESTQTPSAANPPEISAEIPPENPSAVAGS